MHVGGVGLVGFFVVVYQAASGCNSCDSKSLISCKVSGGRFFVVGFRVVVVACVVLWVVGGGWVTLMVAVSKLRQITKLTTTLMKKHQN